MNVIILILAIGFLSIPVIINYRRERGGEWSRVLLIAVVGISGLLFEHYVLRNVFALDLSFSPQFVGAEIIKSIVLLGFGSRIKSLT